MDYLWGSTLAKLKVGKREWSKADKREQMMVENLEMK